MRTSAFVILIYEFSVEVGLIVGPSHFSQYLADNVTRTQIDTNSHSTLVVLKRLEDRILRGEQRGRHEFVLSRVHSRLDDGQRTIQAYEKCVWTICPQNAAIVTLECRTRYDYSLMV